MRRPIRMHIAVVVLGLAAAATPGPAYAAETAPGTITGHVVTESPGSVTVNLFTTDGANGGQVFSDAAGNYTFPEVSPGTYKIQFGFAGRFQWSHQKLGYSTADVVTVGSGQTTTVVEETMLLPGAVEVVATDAKSRKPVDTICAGVEEWSMTCGATGGVLRLANLTSGTHTIHVRSTDGLHARRQVTAVSVVLGQTTRVEVALEPTTAITTTVVDRATGEPVPWVCVAAVPEVFHQLDDDTCDWSVNYTDDQGRVTLGELPPGNYSLLVLPYDDVHGIQWVGREGGVGSQYAALRINGDGGESNDVGPVLLDPAASITGVIRDAATGDPLPNGCASLLPARGSVPGLWPSCADGDGVYTLRNVGPYEWPVQFSHFYDHIYPYASVWSGGATDRRSAAPVRAGVETPGVADATLTQTGSRIRLRVFSADGQAYNGWLAGEVYNAVTGDLIKDFSQWTVEGVADQDVLLRYVPNSPWRAGWYGGPDLGSAKKIHLTGDGETEIRIVMPDPS
ncbi:MAG TPA: carboxypeptidase-like regulatory domain-containing protein [Micromonospora sp.]